MSKKKILVIEDNKEVRENVTELLELSDYDVMVAANGKEGVRHALQSSPDLVLCDIMMPELDGFGVARILNRNERTVQIPFIFLTAKAERTDFRHGMALGADDYITKPFDDVELLDAIEVRLQKNEKFKSEFMQGAGAAEKILDLDRGKSALIELAKDREIRLFETKAAVYQEGQVPRWIFYVKSGKIKEVLTNPFGKELIAHIRTEETIVGVAPVVRSTKYTGSAIAMQPTEVVLIPAQEFQELIQTNRQASFYTTHLLATEIERDEHRLLDLAYGNVRNKVAEALTLVYNTSKASHGLGLTVPREDLANLAGVAKETLIRTLSDFKDEGIIEIVDHVIVISDVERLMALSY